MHSEYDYNFNDLLTAYSKLGVGPGKTIYVASDLIRLMQYSEPGRNATLTSHLNALLELLGPEGTLFVPTSSTNICNTKIPFDLASTPSHDMGIFSEFVRTQKNACRSFHPFWSVAGIGPRAKEFLSDVSRHAYGFGSVWQKFVENDVLSVNIGKHPQYSVTVIHHIETVIGVPYRYTKEFIHPVMRDNILVNEPFYMSVLYKDCDIVRDKNRKIFKNFQQRGNLKEERVGNRGFAWSFSHAEFFELTSRLMLDDVYCWLEQPPTIRPYQI